MKKQVIIFLIGSLSFSICLSGQSLVKDNKLWSNTTSPYYHTTDYISSWIKIQGDTLINDTLYKKLYKSNCRLHSSWWVRGAIREDSSGRVYMQSNNRQTLLYDFSVEVGDTLRSEDYDTYADCYVVNIDFIHLDSYEDSLKRIEICGDDICDYRSETWIETIGSLHGMPLSIEQMDVVGGVNMLICMFENDTMKYHNEDFSECFPLGFPEGIREDNIGKDNTRITTFPTEVIFEFGHGNANNSKLRIYDISGRIVETYEINGAERVSISKALFESGIYLYRYQNGTEYTSGKFIIDKSY